MHVQSHCNLFKMKTSLNTFVYHYLKRSTSSYSDPRSGQFVIRPGLLVWHSSQLMSPNVMKLSTSHSYHPLLMHDGAAFSITAMISPNSQFLPFLDHQYLSSDHDRLVQWTVSLFHLLVYFKFSLIMYQIWWPNG